MPGMSFDFEAYRAACTARSTGAWLAFYADDAECIEYCLDPLVLVRRACGRAAMNTILTEVSWWPSLLTLESLEADGDRIRFRLWSDPPGGRLMVEHVMLTIAADRIQRQIRVVAFED